MENFKGFKKTFLGTKFSVSLPKPEKTIVPDFAPVTGSKDNILHYPNYSVLQSQSRKFPIYTASNIDGKNFRSIGRESLFPGGSDRWEKDPRLAKEHQWGDELYSAPKSDFDKGHMTKREDVQWGKTEKEAEIAAQNTFFFTNAVPQRKELNQQVWRSLEDYILKGIIQIAPLAFMRGRTLDNAFVILDEAQNTTHSQMKMFLTRMGKNAKFIITGDPGQVDLPRRTISGLKEAILILKDVEGIGIIYLDDKDIVRHRLVKKVIDAYKSIENHD